MRSPAVGKLRATQQRAWSVRPKVPIDQWCSSHIYMSDIEATRGRLDLADRPYWREVLQAIEDPDIPEVAIMASTQVGKTLILLASILWGSDNDPAPTMLVTPDQPSCIEARDRCYALGEACKPIAPRVPPERKRNLRHMDLGTCRVYLAYAGARQRLRGRPCKRLYMTEVDVYPQDKKAGDPHRAARERVKAFRRSKIVYESSPTDEASTIGKLYEQSDRRKWLVKCPHCGTEQELRFFPHKSGKHAGCGGVGGLKTADDQYKPMAEAIADAHYVCREGCEIEPSLKNEMVIGGRWQAAGKLARRAGFHLWSLMSPVISIGDLVASYYEHKDEGNLPEFFQNWLGIPWTSRDKVPTWKQLGTKLAGVHVRGTVPARAWFLTAGGDVQDDCSYTVIRGWGDGKTSWLIDWQRFPRGEDYYDEAKGMTVRSDLVALARYVLFRSFPVVAGDDRGGPGKPEFKVRLLGIDSNHSPADVHQWHLWLGDDYRRDDSRVRLIKGDHQLNAEERFRKSVIENNTRTGEKYEGGLQQWRVKVNYYKQDLMDRFTVDTVDHDRPGNWYVTADCVDAGRDYLRQVVNEPRIVEKDNRGRTQVSWRPQNGTIGVDFWDCEVYSRTMADMIVGNRDWNFSRWPENARTTPTRSQRAASTRRRAASDLSAR